MSALRGQIERAYAEQRRAPTVPRLATDIPLSYESITDEWLTAVLCDPARGVTVSGHRLGEPDDGTSNRRRIFIEYSQAVAELPASVFAKATHDLANRIMLGHTGGIRGEVTFYRDIRAQLSIQTPHCYHANYDPVSFNSIVLLEDLGGQVEFCDQTTAMSRERAASQLQLLASFHGHFFRQPSAPGLAGLLSWPERFGNVEKFNIAIPCKRGFLEAEEVIPPRLYRRETEIWPATLASVEAHKQLPATLNHGDVHLRNWYVVGEATMGISDWQGVCRGHWSRDFAYTISTALTVENRRAWEKDLLREYLEYLHAAGGPREDFDQAWGHYRRQLLSSLAWWTCTFSPNPGMPDMQPPATSLEFIRRMSHAIDDLDSLDAFA